MTEIEPTTEDLIAAYLDRGTPREEIAQSLGLSIEVLEATIELMERRIFLQVH